MLRKAGERHVLPDDSGDRRARADMPRDQGASASPSSSTRSPTVHFYAGAPHQPIHPYLTYSQSHGPPPRPQQQQAWFEGQAYADPDAHAWANMDLNAGAVVNSGMEAFMIPVG